MGRTDRLAHFLDVGLFREALAEVSQSQTLSTDEKDVLSAELFERLGQPSVAARHAQAALARPKLPDVLRVRCNTLLGHLQLEAGQDEAAVGFLTQAVSEALQAKSQSEVCWSKLRLVVALAQKSSPEELRGMSR